MEEYYEMFYKLIEVANADADLGKDFDRVNAIFSAGKDCAGNDIVIFVPNKYKSCLLTKKVCFSFLLFFHD